MIKEDIGKDKEKYLTQSAALLKNVSSEAKRRPDLLAELIMSWLDEDGDSLKAKNKDAIIRASLTRKSP